MIEDRELSYWLNFGLNTGKFGEVIPKIWFELCEVFFLA